MKTIICFFLAISLFIACTDQDAINPNALKSKVKIKVLDSNDKPIEMAKVLIENNISYKYDLNPIISYTNSNGIAEFNFYENEILNITVEKKQRNVIFRDIKNIRIIGNINDEYIFKPFNCNEDFKLKLNIYKSLLNTNAKLYIIYMDDIKYFNELKYKYKEISIQNFNFQVKSENFINLNLHKFVQYYFVIEANNELYFCYFNPMHFYNIIDFSELK